ncbi:unnamed protein product [Gongylonema pulchrum]|uniref:Uncharacterized protein n=1 Tax=Gongylonema pulchrum TaxID=637853 RepID=A0A183EQB0_9BILA|nr:unnamed protein product [Gongylonema pulchrum]
MNTETNAVNEQRAEPENAEGRSDKAAETIVLKDTRNVLEYVSDFGSTEKTDEQQSNTASSDRRRRVTTRGQGVCSIGPDRTVAVKKRCSQHSPSQVVGRKFVHKYKTVSYLYKLKINSSLPFFGSLEMKEIV